MAIPLFDRNQRAIAMAGGEAKAAVSDRAAIEQRVAAEARAIFEASQSLAERARRVDEELLAPAALVRLAARASYSEGATNIVAMVDADRVYLDARREVLQVKLDALAAAFEARVLAGEGNPPMTRHVGNEQGRATESWCVLATAIVVVLALGWLATRGGPPAEAPAASAPPAGTVVLSPAATKEAGLRVEAVATTTVRDTIDAPGVLSLDERRTARIASQVEGKVLEVFVEIGDRVPAGRELAHIISRSFTKRGRPIARPSWNGAARNRL